MIAAHITQIKDRIAEICRHTGKDPRDIILVAVTKYTDQGRLVEAVRAGITDIGENRVQDAKQKFSGLEQKGVVFKKHMIGHLQTNKVKDAVAVFDMIQSVDSVRVAREIHKQAQNINKVMDVLVQINASGESQKSGAAPDQALALIQDISGLENIRVLGLMAIGPLTGDRQAIEKCFAAVKKLFDDSGRVFFSHPRVVMKYLSMGMTHDYEIALAQGANMVRIGSAIFG